MSAPIPQGAVVVDTSVISAELDERFSDRRQQYDRVLAGRPLLVSFQTAAELRYGALRARWGPLLRLRRLERLLTEGASSAEGQPLRRNFYRRHFKPAVRSAGLPMP